MKISIVMATWMGERHLPKQLESFLAQTRLPDELVVRDDGSTDRTLSILRQFAEDAPFSVYILPGGPRLGYAANFATALAHARGELIFLSDQDDVWLPHRLETILEIANNRPDRLLIINDVENVTESLNRTGVSKLTNLRQSGLSDDRFITGCATAIQRPLLDLALPLPAGLKAHDYWLHECARWLNARLVVPDVLQLHRRHDANTSGMRASRPKKIRRLSSHLDTLRSKTLDSHRQQLLMANALKERLALSPEKAKSLSNIDPVDMTAALEAHTHALKERIEVLESAWPGRLPRALGFWLQGGYRNFFGWKSLVNDLLSRSRSS